MTILRQTSKQYFRSLAIIYFALLMGQVLFSGVALFLNMGNVIEPGWDAIRDILIFIVPASMVGGILAGQQLYRSLVRRSRGFTELTAKMGAYRNAMLVRLALIEGVSFFSIVAYLMTADLIFLAMTALMVVYFLTLKPGLDKTAMELELSHEEKARIQNPNEIIAEIEDDS